MLRLCVFLALWRSGSPRQHHRDVPAHLQIIARCNERLFEILDVHVQDAKLKIRKAGPEETLRLWLKRAEGTLVIPHSKARPCDGRADYRSLLLDDRVFVFLVRGLSHADGTFRILDSELDKADALTDEPRET